MAKATATSREVDITLTLSQDEALYLYGALNKVDPIDDGPLNGDDTVYGPLGQALLDAGLNPTDGLSYSVVNGAR